MKRSKPVIVLAALVLALFTVTGCTKIEPAVQTIYSTDTLKIESQGAETRVYDCAGNATYTFTTHRVRKVQGGDIATVKTTTDTDTIRLQTVRSLIIATDKTADTTVYINTTRKGGGLIGTDKRE